MVLNNYAPPITLFVWMGAVLKIVTLVKNVFIYTIAQHAGRKAFPIENIGLFIAKGMILVILISLTQPMLPRTP